MNISNREKQILKNQLDGISRSNGYNIQKRIFKKVEEVKLFLEELLTYDNIPKKAIDELIEIKQNLISNVKLINLEYADILKKTQSIKGDQDA